MCIFEEKYTRPMTDELKRFIVAHENDDIFELSLKSNKYKDIDFDFGLKQIAGRQKIKQKLPLFYANIDIHYPGQLSLEQSSSQITAEYKSTLCNGDSLVDLTGGFGIDCCFMSEKFKTVVYVERQLELCNLAKHNFKQLNRNNVSIINAESSIYLSDMENVDWIYMDPARRSSIGKKVVLLSDCEPNVIQLSAEMLGKANGILLKLSPLMDISAVIRELKHIVEIHVISVENECKEILVLMHQQAVSEIKMTTINFRKNKSSQIFTFLLNDELQAQSTMAATIGKYLYEPNASIMKSGAFKLVGKYFSLDKLQVNTHLYSSEHLIEGFPGRVFEIVKVWENSKKSMDSLSSYCKKANITTRNYPIKVAEIRQRLKIQDGGNIYLFACCNLKNEKVIIECIKAQKE